MWAFPRIYVYRETKHAVDGASGTSVAIRPGIDIEVPTPRARCTPESVQAAVEAALRAGEPGVLLSRTYLEVKPENLSAAGAALA